MFFIRGHFYLKDFVKSNITVVAYVSYMTTILILEEIS